MTSPDSPLRIGTLGTARITPKALLQPAGAQSGVSVAAVAARDVDRARAWAREHAVPKVLSTYDELIASPEIDAIYNPLPPSLHAEWSLRALEQGKHVLCEKPFTQNEREARQVADAAKSSGLVVCEAFHTRYHPLMLRALDIAHSGQLGDPLQAEAFFNAPIENTPSQIRYRYDLGGGATMDLGCYPLHWLRHLLRSVPSVTQARAVVGPEQIDVAMEIELDFDGVPARVQTDMRPDCEYGSRLEIRGSEATMRVINPLVPQLGHRLELETQGRKMTEDLGTSTTFQHQLEAFCQAVRAAQRGDRWSLPTDAEDGVHSMRVLDAVYRTAGLATRGTQR
ncbi:MAG: Gfo/Idh/MocA family oxidoreductase [Acidobacteriota bacterium]